MHLGLISFFFSTGGNAFYTNTTIHQHKQTGGLVYGYSSEAIRIWVSSLPSGSKKLFQIVMIDCFTAPSYEQGTVASR